MSYYPNIRVIWIVCPNWWFYALPPLDVASSMLCESVCQQLSSWEDVLLSSVQNNLTETHWNFPTSLACVAGILYMEFSLPISLQVWVLVWSCTWISIQSLVSNMPFGDFFIADFQRHISCLISYARFVHWPLPGRTDERKISSTILSSFQMNVTASGLIFPHYACSPTLQLVFMMWRPWWWCLKKYIFMGSG
jgi:hypothetical protein